MPPVIATLQASPTVGKVVQSTQKAAFQTALSRFLDETDAERIDVAEFLDFEISNIQEAEKITRPNFERHAKNFIGGEPEVIFVSEYIVEDQFAGSLLVWEKYLDATHYEIFKRNIFSQNSEFERILFLDKASLEEEKNRLVTYVRDILGFSELDENEIMIFLDHRVKEDRIYEYKVRATRIPQQPSDIDYDLALESKDLLTPIPLTDTSTVTLSDFAGVTLGSEDMSWILSLVNENVRHFGRGAVEKSLVELIQQKQEPIDGEFPLVMPKNIGDLLKIISESIALFGVRESFGHVVDVMGGLTKEFRCAFIDAIDETRDVFSYDRFKLVISAQLPVFELLLNLSESASRRDKRALSSLSIVIPTNKGSEALTSVDGLSKIFKFVNDSLIAVLYSQDKETFTKLQEIIEAIRIDQGLEEEPVEEATREILQEEEDNANDEAEEPVTIPASIQEGIDLFQSEEFQAALSAELAARESEGVEPL